MKRITLGILVFCFILVFSKECNQNNAVKWTNFLLDILKVSSKDNQVVFTPPIAARAIFILEQAMHDSMSAFTNQVVSTFCQISKFPEREHTLDNIELAISTAAYTVIKNMFSVWPSILQRNQEFYHNSISGRQNEYARQTGQICAASILESRKSDGSNEYGDEPGTKDSQPYSDYTNHQSVNPGQTVVNQVECSRLNSLTSWMGLLIYDKNNVSRLQFPWTPHMSRVKPFAVSLDMMNTVKPPPLPNTNTNSQFYDEVYEILGIFANLDDEKKVIAEHWADGLLESSSPSGHWTYIAMEMIQKKCIGIIDSLRLLFLQAAASFDAGIITWAIKRYYEYARPITVIKCFKRDQTIVSWKGYYLGVGNINGSLWIPYQDPYFVTPPFSEFCSGHSAFAAASAEILKRFFDSDVYGGTYIVKSGESLYEPKITDPNNPKFINGVTNVPNNGPFTVGYSPAKDVLLHWPTFTDAATQCGQARLFAGVHWRSGNVECLKLGKRIGKVVFETYFNKFY